MLRSDVFKSTSIVNHLPLRCNNENLKWSWCTTGKGDRHRFRAAPVAASQVLHEVAVSGDLLDTLFVSGVSLSIAVNIGISALPLLVGAKDAEKLKQIEEDDTQDIKWGVMSLLSFFPLLNWLVSACSCEH